MKSLFALTVWTAVAGIMLATSCGAPAGSGNVLREKLEAAISDVPGRVGIAVISPEGDTLTVNNSGDYQLMSVFKLHQALAVAHALDLQGVSLDTVIRVRRTEFDPDTWSPVLKEHPDSLLSLTMTEWLSYLLQQSDNNVSNMLFQRIASVAATDSFIRASTGITDFRLTVMEEQMHRDHSLADGNRSTPLACASLIRKVFTDSLVSPVKQKAICRILSECRTGLDRIHVPLAGESSIKLAHKTGSGFRTPQGILMAHNDVGYVTLPDGRAYVLAVLVKDFDGSEAEASAVIAAVSAIVYEAYR